jgi:serine/threonine-protein kinase
MFELHILGSPVLTRITANSTELCAIQPKRLALLAYLAIADQGRTHRRDVLTGLFWQDHDQSRARGALRQALRYLRNILGDQVLITRGNDEVALATDALHCDVLEFETALNENRLEDALSHYRGDLLTGLFISGASSEFEHWLDREATRLRDRARGAARALALRAEEEGDPDQCAIWMRREIEFSPYSEEPARRLIQLLADTGRRSEAVAVYQAFAQRLSTDLELRPSPSLSALIETISSGAHEGVVLPANPSSSELPPSDPTALNGSNADEELSVPIAYLPDEEQPVLSPRVGARERRGWRLLAPYLTAGVVATAVFLLVGGSFWSARAADSTGVVSLHASPFQIAGGDSSILFLREELPQMLIARLTPFTDREFDLHLKEMRNSGRSGGTPWDSGRAAWPPLLPTSRGTSLRLQGEVMGSPSDLAVHASLVNTADGRVLAVARVTGPVDSLSTLADRLVAQIVVPNLLGDAHRFSSLMDDPLPALLSYLEARSALRLGDYPAAAAGFQQVLQHEPASGLAALGLIMAGMHLPGTDIGPALTLAQRERAQLNVLDQAFLDALSAQSTVRLEPLAQRLANWEHIVQIAPDQPESWFWLGDLLYHWGPSLGIVDASERARSAFEHALELDPGFIAPLTHLVDLSAMPGISLSQRHSRYRHRAGSDGELWAYLDWRSAILSGDSALLGPVRERLGSSTSPTLIRLLGVAQLDGVGLDDAERAAHIFRAQGGAANGNWFSAYLLHHYELNRGRPTEALRLAKQIQVLRPEGILRWQLPVFDAIFSDGDMVAAEAAALQLSRLARLLERSRSKQAKQARHGALCTSGIWRLHNGERHTAPAIIAALREDPSTDDEPGPTAGLRTGCATLLETLLATLDDPAAPLAPLEELARQQQTGHLAWDTPHLINLLLTRLYEERGDLSAALATLRRRPYHPVYGIPYLSTFLYEEARLAALTGDTAGASRAYRHYLALRSDPEPALAGKIYSVRATLNDIETAVH